MGKFFGPHKGGTPPRDDLTIDRVIPLVDRGMSIYAIARELKCSADTIRKKFKGAMDARRAQNRALGKDAPRAPLTPAVVADEVVGLPDGMIAALLKLTLDQLLPRYRDVIDGARAALAAEIAGTFVRAARGRSAVRNEKNELILPEIEPDLKAGETLLNRLSFFEAPMDSEIHVRVTFDDPPIKKIMAKAADTKLRDLGDDGS